MTPRQKLQSAKNTLSISSKAFCSQLAQYAWLASLVEAWCRLPSFHRKGIMVLVPVLMMLALLPLPDSSSSSAIEPETARREVALDLTPLDKTTKQAMARVEASSKELVRSAWVSYTIQQGDTLTQVFRNNHLPLSDLNQLITIEGPDKPLSNLHPGQWIRYRLTKTGDLDILQLENDGHSVMFFRLSTGGFGRSQ